MRLVDDDHVVLGQHIYVGGRVDRQQRVVGHHDVRPGRRVPRPLGETAGGEPAAMRADALLRAHRDLAPGRLGHAGHQFVPIAGLRLLGPLVQPLDLTAQRRGGAPLRIGQSRRVEQRVLRVVGHPALLALQAQVVAPALKDGEGRLPAEQRRQRRDQPRQVAVDQLALQRDGGRGHHDRAARRHRVPHRRDQIGQRLSGPRSGLHGQVLAGLDGLPYGLGHGDLAGPFRAADAADGGGEEFGDIRRGGHIQGDWGHVGTVPRATVSDDDAGHETWCRGVSRGPFG